MTPKRWLALLVFYVSYLLFGASIYYHIESQQEIEQRAEELEERIAINGKYWFAQLCTCVCENGFYG